MTLSAQQRLLIGRKIWQNECGGTIEGLTSWNKGEAFASMGIGHFIWCARNNACPFSQTFPSFIRYLEQHKVALPSWLTAHTLCPWKTRAEFRAAHNSARMKQIRELLIDTIDLQISFIIERLEIALPRILHAARDTAHARAQCIRLGKTAGGLYAMIDYVNFKGEGLIANAQWGLLQVIERMHGSDPRTAPADFASNARTILTERANNRNEQHWLAGWERRLASYIS
jgi:hypothetical protein